MKNELKITKKTAFILILILVVSAVMGFGIKDWLSRQGGDDNYVAPTTAPAGDVLYPATGNESGMSGEQGTSAGESLPPAEPELAPTGNHAEPDILDSDLIWFDDLHASCYDRKTDLWIVYEARIGEGMGVFGDRTVYRYDDTDSHWELFASKSPDEIRLIKGLIIPSGDVLYLSRWNNTNTTWVEHSKEGSTLKLGSGRVWFSGDGADCYDGLRTISSSISEEDGIFSCAVSGGVPPITYNWKADQDGQIGDASSFEPELPNGMHAITLVVTDASGRTATDSVEITIT